jgi:hypothetical protein
MRIVRDLKFFDETTDQEQAKSTQSASVAVDGADSYDSEIVDVTSSVKKQLEQTRGFCYPSDQKMNACVT